MHQAGQGSAVERKQAAESREQKRPGSLGEPGRCFALSAACFLLPASCSLPSLLVTQRHDRVERGRATGGPDAEDHAYYCGEDEGQDYRAHRDVGVPVRYVAQ